MKEIIRDFLLKLVAKTINKILYSIFVLIFIKIQIIKNLKIRKVIICYYYIYILNYILTKYSTYYIFITLFFGIVLIKLIFIKVLRNCL